MTDTRTEPHGEIVAADEGPTGGALAVSSPQSTSLIERILDGSTNPDLDAEKMKTMTELALKLRDREQLERFNVDLNAAIMEMPRITKRGEIIIPAKDGKPERLQGRFAKFEDIDFVVRPILARHNLTIRFEVDHSDAYVTVCPILSHANGYVEKGGRMKLPLDSSGSKNNTQGVGSSTSYGKRYAMCAALNIVLEGEDDDGTRAGGGALRSDPVSDVQSRLIELGQKAAQEGGYQEWFEAQDPRDRAWLVQTGRHAEFGGEQQSLPAPSAVRQEPAEKPSPPPPPPAAARRSAPPPPPPPPPASTKRSPEQMVGEYKSAISKCADADAVEALKGASDKFLGQLEAKFPALWQQCEDAYALKLDSFRLDDEGDDDAPKTLV